MNFGDVETLEDMQAVLDSSPYIRFLGLKAEVFSKTEERLEVSMASAPALERAEGSGQFHGGPIAGMIDTIASCLLAGVLGKSIPTINFRVDYVRPSYGEKLIARATARRLGRTIAVCDVDVFDQNDKLVAVGRGTFSTA